MYSPGEKLRIRDRRWQLVGVKLHEGNYVLEVVGLDEDNRSLTRNFIHSLEEIERLPGAGLTWNVREPRFWKAVHTAYLLAMQHGENYLTSLARARIELEDYQLAAVLKAFKIPRQRLLIADDVGIGKSVEASLVMMELMTRGRGDRVLIVTPASLMDQWQDELFDKFGLNFEIFDSDTVTRLVAQLPRGANPWQYRNRIIASIDYAKRDDVKRALRDVIWNLVVIDEAHYLAETSSGKKPVRTKRSKFGEFITERTDGLLLLTGTPHDGYAHSLYSLIRLIDPFLCTGPDDLESSKLKPHVIRRLKGEITNPDGSPRFQTPRTGTIELHYEKGGIEADLYSRVCKYAKEVSESAKVKQETNIVVFAMMILKKRLISSPEALRRSLNYRFENLTPEPTETSSYRGLLEDYVDGVPLSEQQAERAEKALLSATIPALEEKERRELPELSALADKLTEDKDTKAARLLEFLSSREQNDKVIVFTEYRDTQEYLKSYLEKRGFAGKIAILHGGMTREQRKDVGRQIHQPDTTVLLATDAASEGLNFQRDFATIVHYELPWNPNRLEQRNGRVDRWGQNRIVHIYNLYLADTYESEILEILKRKIDQIRKDTGSVTDILGTFTTFELQDILMETGGLIDEIDDAKGRIKKATALIDQRIAEGQTTLQSWKAQMLLGSNPFSEAERSQVQFTIDRSAKTLPTSKDIEELVTLILKEEGGTVEPAGRNGIYRVSVPRHLLSTGVQQEYHIATFDRNIAISNEDAEFLSYFHPLVQAVVNKLRSRLHDPDGYGRMSYRVIERGQEGGILFTYIARFIDGSRTSLQEVMFPVFVNLDGIAEESDQKNFDLMRTPGIPLNVPSSVLDSQYKARWQELRRIAQDFAKQKLAAMLDEVQEKNSEQCDIKLKDLDRWSEDVRKKVIERYYADPQMRIDQPQLTVHRLTEELRRLNERIKERREKLSRSRPVNLEGPEDLGALLIVPEALIRR